MANAPRGITMRMESWLVSFADEMDKIAVSTQHSPFLQLRRGRRPLRVSTLLRKDEADPISVDRERRTEPNTEIEAGAGMQDAPSEFVGG